MHRTALLVDRRYAGHRNPPGHPEHAGRIDAVLRVGEAADPGRIVAVTPRPATRDEIRAVHTASHFDRVAASAKQDFTIFDGDTTAVPRSFDTALLAAGGLLEVIDAVVDGRADNGFAFVRPPGHHAESDRIMGFCLFNNVAVGAAHLRRRHGLERVLVLDWDVHHGNGTQEIFWKDGGVMYISLHEHPAYPGTGAASERGEGDGEGTTRNIPLAAGSGDAEYAEAARTVVLPAIREFAPEFLLISAGFDAHRADPLANMRVTDRGFALLARMLMDAAADCCDGRVAAVLEGGYDLAALRSASGAVLDQFWGAPAPEERT